MMHFPDCVPDIITAAVADHPNDIPAATDQACGKLRELPEYDGLVRDLVTYAVQEMIYSHRGSLNSAFKNFHGGYDTRPRLNYYDSPASLKIHDSLYRYCIAGKTLGELLGSELTDLAARERLTAKGHTFNADLVDWLRQQNIGPDQKVQEVISEKKLRLHFNRLHKRVFNDDGFAQAGD